jgi:hypothetical protein
MPWDLIIVCVAFAVVLTSPLLYALLHHFDIGSGL